MNIFVLNKSSVLTDAEIQSWMPGLNKFVHHVREYWPRPANLIWCDKTKEPSLAWKLIFADTSDEAGALGYHDFTPDGRPISYVFAADDIKYGYSPTVTATHEIAEMIADPWISELFQTTNTEFYAKEVCDPCEADKYGYGITTPGFPTINVSDFVTPMWFIPGAHGKFDKTNHINSPLQLLDGGYMSVFTSGQGWSQIYAETKGKGSRVVEVAGHEAKLDNRYSRLMRYDRNRGGALHE